MRFAVWDNPGDKGVELEFDFESGMAIRVFLDDSSAQELVDIVQNKLNARFLI